MTTNGKYGVGDLIEAFIVYCSLRGINWFPFMGVGWHTMFYNLKGKLMILIRFNWDGPYPQAPIIDEYFDAISAIGAIDMRSDGFFCISPEMIAIKEKSLPDDWEHHAKLLYNEALQLEIYFPGLYPQGQ
jgi:hypothetical protein